MYSFRYEAIQVSDNGTNAEGVELYAKFRFGEEVAPIKRKFVRNRYSRSNVTLDKFMKEIENVQSDPSQYNVYISEKDSREITITPCWVRLGFDIKVTSKKLLPLEQMLHMQKLNDAILSGQTQAS